MAPLLRELDVDLVTQGRGIRDEIGVRARRLLAEVAPPGVTPEG